MTPALIKRVESARGPDREIDRALVKVAGGEIETFRVAADHPTLKGGLEFVRWPGDATRAAIPPYTSSLDAAVSLCERLCPEAFWRVGHAEPDDPREYTAAVITTQGKVSRSYHDATPAFALVLAVLRAVGESK